ncbi:hypothetical protein [Aureispira anguillae]|uniref:Uncharacterized protein n=1 Tax=Aureispira anguillae TaxID=2864201 RepID=A0A915YH59_9BACT|nr:hypothetical protein [Aureispira anguillae]BDS13079.1 hypothetical protein AsAng_0038070 [Aureispira anguillae]
MAKKIKLELTEKEFGFLIDAIDDISAMIGGGEPEADEAFIAIVENLDGMLKKNGYKRLHS